MAIFPAQSADANELSILVNSAYRGESSRAGWTTEADFLDGQRTDPDRILNDIRSPGRVILTLRETEKSPILGCVYLENLGSDCYLGMLTVRPGLQTQGYGQMLMNAAEAQARSWRCKNMVLGVIQLRDSLIQWYERRGYQKTGETRPFPYHDPLCGLPKRNDLHFVMFRKPLLELHP